MRRQKNKRFWTGHGYANRYTRLSRPVSYGLANSKPSFHIPLPHFTKKQWLGILIIGLIGLLAVDQVSKLFVEPGHSSIRLPYDPTTLLWQSTGVSGNNAEFNTAGNAAAFTTTGFDSCSGCKAIALTSSSTVATEALTNSSITSLSQSVSKDLLLSFQFYLNGNPTINVPFYYFLTTNSSIYSTSAQTTYNPLNDKSVVYAIQISCVASCAAGTRTYSVTSFLPHRPFDSINSELPTGVCTTSSSCFESYQTTSINPLSHIALLQEYLNYTGGTTQNAPCNVLGGGGGCSELRSFDDTGATGSFVTQLIQPPLLQQPNYYLGIFTSPNFGSQLVTLYDTGTYSVNSPPNACLDIASAQNGNNPPCNVRSLEADIVLLVSSSPTAPPPTIDTSGFFGPVIKAFISIGVFVVANLLAFVGFIEGFIIGALNSIGNFFGWGNIGSTAQSEINAVFTYFSNSVSWLGNLITQSINVLNAISGWFATGISGATTFFSPVGSIVGFIVIVTQKVFQFGVPSFVFLLAGYYFYNVIFAGLEGFFAWWQTMKWMIFHFMRLGFRIADLVIKFISWLVGITPTLGPKHPWPELAELIPDASEPGHFASGTTPALLEGDPFSWMLTLGGLFVFWQYLASGISPLSNLRTGLNAGCAPTVCVSTGINTVYPLLGIWLVFLPFLFMEHISRALGFHYISTEGLPRAGVPQIFPKRTRKEARSLLKGVKKFLGESIDAKGVRSVGMQLKKETRQEIAASTVKLRKELLAAQQLNRVQKERMKRGGPGVFSRLRHKV